MPSKMSKCIWIVNYYTSSPELASNPRYLEFASFFQKQGYQVLTFNSSVKHGTSISLVPKGMRFLRKQYGEFDFVHIKSPRYVGNGAKRMWSIFVFSLRLLLLRRKFPKPDVILHNLHTPFDYPIVWVSKLSRAKYVAEAWDLWPRAFANYGLISESSLVMKVAYAIERHLYCKADRIIFTMEGGIDYLRDHKWTTDTGGPIPPEKVHYINNGINLAEFDVNRSKYPRPDEDMNDPSLYKIVYMGSIRLVNCVKEIIDAAAILKDNPKYRFFLYGDGADRPALEQYVKENHLDNVVFKEKRIPLWEVAWVVSQATVNLMNYEPNFGHYGASSGKMFQYMAAGRPICCNIQLGYSEIEKHKIGISRPLSSPQDYASAIKALAEQSDCAYREMCQRARKAAEEFDYNRLSVKELEVIQSCL